MLRHNSTGQFVVKPHNPKRRILSLICGSLGLMALVWVTFEFGRFRAGYDSVAVTEEVSLLKAEIYKLEKRNADLLLESATFESASQIDAEANGQIKNRLTELNEEMMELKAELAFYRSLLSPSDSKPGIHINSFKLTKDETANEFNYEIVLTQARRNDRFARGDVQISLDGVRQGEALSLSLQELLPENVRKLKFKFKYFQSLEGKLKIPDNFEPKMLLVKVDPVGSRLKVVEQSYDWNTLMVGG